MDSYKITNFREKEIEDLLKECGKIIEENRFTISRSEDGQKNQEFIETYNLSNDRIKQILLNIDIKDFCYALLNRNEKHPFGCLYVFIPEVMLAEIGEDPKSISIYIKIGEIINNRVIVISFHKAKYKEKYLFK